jgi:hypothetical protein
MIRLASKADHFPYGWPGSRVCYFTIANNRPVPMRYRDDMRVVLAKKKPPMIFAVWPGQYRSDLFVIDDIEQLRKAVMQ